MSVNTYTLTTREYTIAHGICRGMSNKEIAGELGIALPTVKSHVSAVMFKLGVKSRTQIALHFAALGAASTYNHTLVDQTVASG